jgi:L-amino acid N-acyltransferase YncA
VNERGSAVGLTARDARLEDAPAIARIYNAGIDGRQATFETRHRQSADVAGWIGGRYPVVVVTAAEEIVAFAAASAYRPRACYAGIAEFSVYVDPAHRRRGAGRLAMDRLIDACRRLGFWKLLSRVFVENTASRELLKACGFREVGTYERHARLDGHWRDVVIVELLLGEAAAPRP